MHEDTALRKALISAVGLCFLFFWLSLCRIGRETRDCEDAGVLEAEKPSANPCEVDQEGYPSKKDDFSLHGLDIAVSW